MFLTATEARTKWCPFVRIEGSNRFDNTLNDGFVNTPSPYHCIAEECMQWREVRGHLKQGVLTAMKDHGFCGVGIKPDFD
ncbi:MAG: hypothetical protein JNL56_07295 [Alphaproteobacteria bacterium]|nr:hypothetical protein [Alphaproteobacteria bacterium]